MGYRMPYSRSWRASEDESRAHPVSPGQRGTVGEGRGESVAYRGHAVEPRSPAPAPRRGVSQQTGGEAMRCLFHRWREIACAPGTVSMESVVFRSSAEEQVVSRLYRCHRCGKRKGILTRLDGS